MSTMNHHKIYYIHYESSYDLLWIQQPIFILLMFHVIEFPNFPTEIGSDSSMGFI